METFWHSTSPVIPSRAKENRRNPTVHRPRWKMGFFSSRTSEQPNFLQDDLSVVQVIRSRFVRALTFIFSFATNPVSQYGKYKGKQRETFVNISSPQLLHVGNRSQKSVDRDSLSPSSLNRSSSRSLEPSSPRSAPRAHTDAITFVYTFS